jgi:hypothetical protein
MKWRGTLVGASALALIELGTGGLAAQEPLPLMPLAPGGDVVAPFFDGWYRNPDGTFTLSFGFFNRNTGTLIEIPIGENNFIEPAEFNGAQPTSFPPVSYGGFSGRRERGAFAVRVPADYADREVVWTLTANGKTHSVPGRITADAYELGYTPMAAGSQPPLLRFGSETPAASGREGVTIERSARIGIPLDLAVEVEDRGERERRVPVNVTWQKHQGPGPVAFAPASREVDAPGGEAVTTATFSEPGEYVLRVRVDNFTMSDSSFADQCCWSNGYVRVRVSSE